MSLQQFAAASQSGRQPKYNLAPTKDLATEERLRLDNCEKRIERGLKTFEDVSAAFLEIRDGLLYRKMHSSFEAYCRERWNLGARRGRQLADAAEVMRNLAAPSPWPKEVEQEATERTEGNHGSALSSASSARAGTASVPPDELSQPELPTGERQVRPLTKLPKEEQKPAWAEARATAAQRGEPVTARDVEKAVEKRVKPEPEPEPDPEPVRDENPDDDAEAFQVATPAKEKTQTAVSTAAAPATTKPKHSPEAISLAKRLYKIAYRAGFPQEPVKPWNHSSEELRKGFVAIAHFHLNVVGELQRELEETKSHLSTERDIGGLQGYLLRHRESPKIKAKPKQLANYVICRHEKGAKAKYWSGPMSWTNNPALAKKLSAAAANVRLKKTQKYPACDGDYVISLAKATMRFAKARRLA